MPRVSFTAHLFTLVAPALLCAIVFPVQAQDATLDYPDTRTVDTVDTYHGTEVPDPYRWLEDLDSEATQAWVEEQNAVTFGYLDDLPARERLTERLTDLWDFPKYGVPTRKGDYLFYAKNSGLQNQDVHYVEPVGGGETRVLIDPNTLSEDGTVALSSLSYSDDGRYVAYGTSASGSDWQTFRIRDVETGEDLDETLEWIKFSSAAWNGDGTGFYYGRYPEPKEGEAYEEQTQGMRLYYHELGTPQSADQLVYERPDNPKLGFWPTVTHDGRYLVITVWEGTAEENAVYYQDLTQPDADIQPLLTDFDASYTFAGNDGTTFYFLTNNDAPNKRLVALDAASPDASTWRTLIPESDAVLQNAQIINERFVVNALDDVKARVTIHGMDGTQESVVELPTIGSVGGVSGERGHDVMYYGFTSYTYPTTIYRYDFTSGTAEVYKAPELDFDAAAYATKQVFYRSKDGTEVPMFIVHKKGLAMDGTNPTYLYGYGGFNISLTPRFSISDLVWLENGGIVAVPNLRGGGEYGEQWHKAGMLDKKQNVFDDFAAAAEYLIEGGYTSTGKLAIAGGSNGGLLTGASITQRPDLFGAAIIRVGVLDMLRYHKFTIGWAWVPEYGSSEDPAQFEYLYNYSPLHNIEPGTAYPPTLIMTADTDDRVVPSHSYKFAATLQKAHSGAAPVLLRVETKAGHGAGKPTSKIIEGEADKWAFLMDVLNIDLPEPTSDAVPSAPKEMKPNGER